MAHLKQLRPKSPSPFLVFIQWIIIIGGIGVFAIDGILGIDMPNWIKLPAVLLAFLLVANLLAALIIFLRAPEQISKIEKKILYVACAELGILVVCPIMLMLISLIDYIWSLL